jgi:hypothetical protein
MSSSQGDLMTRYLKYVALLAVLMVPVAYSQAQVRVAVGVGPVGVVVGHPYVAGPPVCSYGYYDYYPYACAPYGYYGPSYFVDGVFIGAGPWYHWGHPARFWNRGYAARSWYGRPGYYGHGYRGAYERGYIRGREAGGFHARSEFRGGGFHGGGYGRWHR